MCRLPPPPPPPTMRRVGDADQERSLSKDKYDGAWSPCGWVTIVYYALHACPKISLESSSLQTLQKSFRWDDKPKPCVYIWCMQKGRVWDPLSRGVWCSPAPRFLWSQVLCRLCKSPSDETINQSPVCIYDACKKVEFEILWAQECGVVHTRAH